MLPSTDRPQIRKSFRLQWEPAQNAHVLLYPEGMVRLNRSAGEIMSRCEGTMTIDQVIDDLERSFGQTGLANDVREFLALALERGWIQLVP